jgi:hypothetical protein
MRQTADKPGHSVMTMMTRYIGAASHNDAIPLLFARGWLQTRHAELRDDEGKAVVSKKQFLGELEGLYPGTVVSGIRTGLGDVPTLTSRNVRQALFRAETREKLMTKAKDKALRRFFGANPAQWQLAIWAVKDGLTDVRHFRNLCALSDVCDRADMSILFTQLKKLWVAGFTPDDMRSLIHLDSWRLGTIIGQAENACENVTRKMFKRDVLNLAHSYERPTVPDLHDIDREDSDASELQRSAPSSNMGIGARIAALFMRKTPSHV